MYIDNKPVPKAEIHYSTSYIGRINFYLYCDDKYNKIYYYKSFIKLYNGKFLVDGLALPEDGYDIEIDNLLKDTRYKGEIVLVYKQGEFTDETTTISDVDYITTPNVFPVYE
jgi:hypothetical protein